MAFELKISLPTRAQDSRNGKPANFSAHSLADLANRCMPVASGSTYDIVMSRPSSRLLALARSQLSRAKTRRFSSTVLRRNDADPTNKSQDPLGAGPKVQGAPSSSEPAASPAPRRNAATRAFPTKPFPQQDNPFREVFQGLRTDMHAARAGKLQSEAGSFLGLNKMLEADDNEGKNDGHKPSVMEQQKLQYAEMPEPFHFHVYSHKHNTHLTVTKPDRNAIINVSAGQIGFRKSKRGTYDAAYQLTSYVMDKLHQGNWHNLISKMEVVLRGFGHGREAATKILLGNEGRLFRDKITKVSDATRLKFGGTRSPKPRRLG